MDEEIVGLTADINTHASGNFMLLGNRRTANLRRSPLLLRAKPTPSNNSTPSSRNTTQRLPPSPAALLPKCGSSSPAPSRWSMTTTTGWSSALAQPSAHRRRPTREHVHTLHGLARASEMIHKIHRTVKAGSGSRFTGCASRIQARERSHIIGRELVRVFVAESDRNAIH